MKKLFYLSLALAGLSLCGCSSDKFDSQTQMPGKSPIDHNTSLRVKDFEHQFVKRQTQAHKQNNLTRSSSSPLSTQCFGYVTIAYHGDDSIFVNRLWSYYQDSIAANGHFLTLDGKVRVYFPLREAIVTIGKNTYEADSLGIVHHGETNINTCKIIARKKTGHSIYTKFSSPYAAETVYASEGALIVNLGERNLCAKGMNARRLLKTRSETSGEKVSCTRNHSPYPNCTAAFNCAQPRCVTKYDRCMDYNGFGTDCSGSSVYFVGSDCSVAMKSGHCWNEVM